MRRGFRRRHEMLDLTFGPQPPELFELQNGAIVGDPPSPQRDIPDASPFR
jgi:hypothetical protein